MNKVIAIHFVGFAVVGFAAADVVAYREIFAHSGTDAPNFTNGLPTNGGSTATIDWFLRGANMTGHVTNLSTGGPVNTVAAGTGIAANLSAINAGPQQGSQISKGFAVVPGGTVAPVGNNAPHIMYTSEYALGLAGATRFSWYQGNHSASDGWRVAIELDGANWFVSDLSFTNAPITSGGTFATGGEFKQLTTLGALWRPLDFNGSLATNSGTLAMGAAGAVSGTTITRFGMFTDSKTSNMRFDTFQIDAVPEPTTLGLAAIGALALRGRRLKPRVAL